MVAGMSNVPLYTEPNKKFIRVWFMSLTSIPAEIFDHIFSFLQSDPTTLARCSSAHPILSSYAEPFLYADIFLRTDSESDIDDTSQPVFLPDQLHKLLIESPHIANYIRNLQIQVSVQPQNRRQLADGIVPILPMMLQLRSISVTSDPAGFDLWGDRSSKFRAAFINRLRSSSSVLEGVSLWPRNFPLSVFDSCKTVKRIALFGGQTHQETDLQVMPPQLDSLSLHKLYFLTSTEFLAWTNKRIRNLRSLSLHAGSVTIRQMLPELVRTCSNSLASLDLDILPILLSPADSLVPSRLDLSSVLHLKYLTIGARLKVDNADLSYHAFPMIIELLQTTTRLNKLTFNFRIVGYGEPNFNLFDWSPLLSLFSRSLANFGHIKLHLSLQDNDRPVVASDDILPQLFHSEIVLDMIQKGILDIRTEK